MSQSSKLYKVKLAQGFNAAGRRRAGVVLEKGVTQVLELTDEQVKELEQDVWFVVAEAGKDDKPGSVTETPGSTGGEEEVTDPYEGVSFNDLKAQATEKGLDIKGLRSRDAVIEVLKGAENQDPAGGTSYEEHVTDGIRYFKDGDKIVAVQDEGFTNLEESLAGFGETEEEALQELNKAIELADELDEEEVTISEDMPLDDLKKIAEEQGVENLDTYTEDNKAELIKAIEEASANTEE